MGLVSFAAIAILGLLPVGLTSLRQSMNQTVEAQIVRSIGAQAVTANFTQLAASDLRYDEEGQVTTSDPYYTVTVTTNTPVYPGSSLANNLAGSLQTVRIQIVGNVARTTNTYAIQVANSGK